MGNCVSMLKRKREPNKAITLAIIGVDNVGKTTLCSVFSGELPDPDVAPTIGFRNIKFTHSQFDITLFDLGGGKNIRPIWKNYYGEIYGVIYVVDSSSPSTLYEAREVLRDTLEHPQISGKPVLILANKVDKEDHFEEVDIVNGLKLEESVNANNCPSKMVMVSALQGSGSKMDKELEVGLGWLLEKIRSVLGTLEPRVQDDIRRAKEAKDKEREERRARVKKQREEREKKEAMERERLGLSKDHEESDEDLVDGGDPFKTLDVNKLTQKEQRLKEEKRRRAELMKQFERGSPGRGMSRDDSQLRSAADDNFRSGLVSRSLDQGDTNYAALNLFSNRRKGGSTLPPLEPLGSTALDAPTEGRKKGKKKKKLTDFGKENTGRDEGRLGLNMQDADSWNRDIGAAHDLTPRVAKPKKGRSVKAGRIEEDVGEDDLYKERGVFEKNLFSIDKGNNQHKQNKYDDVYPAKGSNRELSRLTKRNQDQDLEREDSMYKHSLKKLSPPNMMRFEEEDEENEKDEGIEEDSDNESGDAVSSYRAGRNARNYNTNRMNGSVGKKKQQSRFDGRDNRSKGRSPLSDEDQEEYLSSSILKETMKFPTSPTDDDVPIDFRKEMQRLHERKNQTPGYKSRDSDNRYAREDRLASQKASRGKKYYDDDEEEEEEEEVGRYNKSSARFRPPSGRSEEDDEDRVGRNAGRFETPKKKKRSYLLRSNKLAPSDDEELEPQASYRFTSPRMVQEQGSRNGSDAETPTKNRNSRMTNFHSNSNKSRDSASDFSAKWGLAEDLPSIDDGNMRRFKTPNFDESDENVMF